MKLFLSSYRFGAHYPRLAELVGEPGPVAVIANACDAWPAAARASALTSELAPLRKLGYRPRELDLRQFVGRPDELADTLAGYPFVWVRGGNTFVLRAQLARTGGDAILTELLTADAIVYGGYSAGACLPAPSLRGLETVDDPDEVRPTCHIETRWDGLALVDHQIVVHLNSATDPTGDATRQAARYRADAIPHWLLTDDDAIVVDHDGTHRC